MRALLPAGQNPGNGASGALKPIALRPDTLIRARVFCVYTDLTKRFHFLGQVSAGPGGVCSRGEEK